MFRWWCFTGFFHTFELLPSFLSSWRLFLVPYLGHINVYIRAKPSTFLYFSILYSLVSLHLPLLTEKRAYFNKRRMAFGSESKHQHLKERCVEGSPLGPEPPQLYVFYTVCSSRCGFSLVYVMLIHPWVVVSQTSLALCCLQAVILCLSHDPFCWWFSSPSFICRIGIFIAGRVSFSISLYLILFLYLELSSPFRLSMCIFLNFTQLLCVLSQFTSAACSCPL